MNNLVIPKKIKTNSQIFNFNKEQLGDRKSNFRNIKEIMNKIR
jgi:hypothetical protein